MNEQKAASFPLSSILMILVALGVVVFTKTQLKDARPAAPEVKERSDQVRARLWQDPFRAVLDQAPATDINAAGTPTGTAFRLDRLADKINGEEGTITILGVTVFGGPFVDDTEHRMRTRYAVLAGLRRIGYYPADPDHLDYVRIDETGSGAFTAKNILPYEWMETRRGIQEKKEKDGKDCTNKDKVVKADKVLVLWINEDVLQKKPLARLTEGIKALRKKADKINILPPFRLIGPAGSTTLVSMAKELLATERLCDNGRCGELNDIEIYSPSATADLTLMDEFKDKEGDFKEPVYQTRFNNLSLRFQRTTSTDSDLAKQLIKELGLRHINMQQENCTGQAGAAECDHVVLISEWDTFYGRQLPKTFRHAVASEMMSANSGTYLSGSKAYQEALKKKEKQVNAWVHRFNYLRGIDGALPGDRQAASSRSDDQQKNLDLETATANLEQAMGRSQYDYVRRLADSIDRLDTNLREQGEGSIKAIGVLGSDFYDKYLVLQALKQRFPGAVYFTTDLDARMLQQDHIKWTRNLIVAASYGLDMPYNISSESGTTRFKLLQGEVPPFRDSYQTSVFLSTMHALRKIGTEVIFRTAQPKIFEIGRQRPYEVTARTGEKQNGNGTVAHKATLRDLRLFGKFAAIFIAAFLLMTLSISRVETAVLKVLVWVRNHYAAAAGIVAAILVVIGLFYRFVYTDPDQEPFVLFEGISIWPTEIIRLCAAALSVVLIRKAVCDLKKNFEEIDETFGLSVITPVQNEDKKQRWDAELWKRRDTSRLGLCVRRNRGEESIQELWKSYATMSNVVPRRVRIIGYIAACMLLAGVFMAAFGQPQTPVRGALSWGLDKFVLFISILCILYLTFFVVDASRLCRDFIRTAAEKTRPWNKSGRDWTEKEEWHMIRLIGKRTETVGRLVFYPFVVWFVLFLSRMRLFDNWDTPPHLALIISLPAIYAWSCAYRLRNAAEKARTIAVERLTNKMIELRTGPQPDKVKADQVDLFIKEIAGMKQGAFASYMSSPVVQSLLVPFGGVGGMTLVDMFTKINL